jgi:phosphate:Na+ symporter
VVKEISFGVIGGLGLFLYGMKLMGDGMQKAAGDRLRRILEILTGNIFLAILVGALVTAVIQSSSATTVMVVGFVNAGLMTLQQAIGVIMGANIGTTITAWLIAINLSEWALPAIGIGVMLTMISKNKTYRYVGQTFLGFGLLFLGLDTMGSSMAAIKESPKIAQLFLSIGKSPIEALLLGVAVTMIIQSSSATTGLVIALGNQGLLTFDAALPIILGANIGTCITAILASIGASRNAKKAALAHLLFNLIGSILAMIFLPWFNALVRFINPQADFAHMVANAHTAFNLANTLLWIGLVNFLVKAVNLLVPGKDPLPQKAPAYLDKRMLNTPSVALSLATKELIRMANIAGEMIEDARIGFFEQNRKRIEDTYVKEDVVDHIQKEVVEYLSTLLSQTSLTKPQSTRMAGLMHIVNDIERIGDHANNLAQFAETALDENINFSDTAVDELQDYFLLVENQFARAVEALKTDNRHLAREVIKVEKEIDETESRLRRAHLKRLNAGACSPFTGVVFVELLNNLERIGDHALNIVEPVLDDEIRIGKIEA